MSRKKGGSTKYAASLLELPLGACSCVNGLAVCLGDLNRLKVVRVFARCRYLVTFILLSEKTKLRLTLHFSQGPRLNGQEDFIVSET